MIFHRRPTDCLICGQPLTRHQQCSGGICDDWRCKDVLLRQDLEEFRRLAAETSGVGRPDDYPVLCVPHRDFRVGPLPEKRRSEFLAHLAEVVEEAREEPEATEPEPPPHTAEPATFLQRICAACEGECCHRGGTHAFITSEMIRGAMADRDVTPEKVHEAYASRLPERTFEGSCVYHTGSGCALPRDMRAVICNTFECKGLDEARRRHEDGGRRAFVVSRKDNRISGSAFVDESEIRRFELGGG
ncbi:MAG: hypothetical protein ACYTDY_16690 [Planctomycetota bacterium]|jgi:hypothetical protein